MKLIPITATCLVAIMLTACSERTVSNDKMLGMWAERFQDGKSLELWATRSNSGEQKILLMFIQPKEGTNEYEAVCGTGQYQTVQMRNGAFSYSQDRLVATGQRIAKNRVHVNITQGCIPAGEYLLKPVRQMNGTISDLDNVEYNRPIE